NDMSDLLILRGDWEAACAACEESLVLFARLADEAATVSQETMTAEPLPPRSFMPTLAWASYYPQIASLAQQAATNAHWLTRRWAAIALRGMGTARLHLGEGSIGRAALQMGWQISSELKLRSDHKQFLLSHTLGWLEAGEYERTLQVTQQVLE